MNNFHTLEVVGRGGETQLHVGKKFKLFKFKGIKPNKMPLKCIGYFEINAVIIQLGRCP